MQLETDSVSKGRATAVSPLYPVLLGNDTRPVPEAFAAVGEWRVDAPSVDRSRYYDRAFAAAEMEHLWKKTWQVVGRSEDIPAVGDRFSYDVGTLSFIIVRSDATTIRAFYNSCRHRGTRLCTGRGEGAHIRCPFHGWSWTPDGAPAVIPGRWDFSGVPDAALALTEVRCATWGENIFINPDPAAEPLETALGVLPQHFADYDYASRWTAVHVRKKVRANWKLAMEAFMEGWHLSETHPQAQAWNGDSSTQYDIWEDAGSQISRSITPSAVPSPELGDEADVRRAIMETIIAVTPPGMPLPDFDSIPTLDRAFAADYRRQVLQAMTGNDVSAASDAWMLDAVQYFMFPNFFPWLGEGAPLWYQFMPFGDDPRESVMDVRFLLPLPAGGQRPPKAPMLELDFDETYRDRQAGFGLFDEVFDQDMGNLPLIQRGVEGGDPGRGQVHFGAYQECRLRAFHARLGRLLDV